MANRPNFIDVRSKSHGGFDMPSPRSFLSSRLHVAGEVPPELSPLDAFAAQSRMLARQLEESANGGNRMSRLPPLTIDALNTGRPGYFRSLSERPPTTAPKSPDTPVSGERTEVEVPGKRPVSVYPIVSGTSESQDTVPPLPSQHINTLEENRGRRPPSPVQDGGYFGARREQSPSSLEPRPSRGEPLPRNVQSRASIEAMRQRAQSSRNGNDNALGVGFDSRTLAPPRSPFAQRSPSPRSMSNDSSDDDYINAASRTGMSPSRKPSIGSSFSSTPISPGMYSMGRSSSISSEVSLSGTRLPRPSFNFSRPLSRASVTGHPVEVPTRQASGDSQPSFVLADDTAHTPVSMHSEGFPDTNSDTAAAPTYTYSKFSLPRGKMLQRNSALFQEGLPQAQFSWETPVPFSNVQTIHGDAPPSPPSRPSTSSIQTDPAPFRPSLDPGRPSLDPGRPSLDPGRPSLDPGRLSYEHNLSTERPSSPSVASSATIKARSQTSATPSADWSADEHVNKAIEYHEAGALSKSTYHLRLAARMDHPTGMLLYALACRHGWGMRPSQAEGVRWLRKAADAVSAEVADDEGLIKEGKVVDIVELKARKAHFALSIYELGVSHMNGWGIEQDKVLALRCFEIAGSWGDADALAEAGFCYAQGVGCKKDLKKSAQFYRQAEAKGISMIGNSWIYKSKYNDGAEDNKNKKSSDTQRRGRVSTDTRHSQKDKDEKKPRDKSRSRNFFGRSKTST